MNIEESKELLSFHSSRNQDINNFKWKNGFLGSLRPFCGELKIENFIEIMECLKILKDEINTPLIDKNIVSDIMCIVYLSKIWASPDGMLGRNNLLTEKQTNDLLTWVSIIEGCFTFLLDDMGEDAFFEYNDYINEIGDKI